MRYWSIPAAGTHPSRSRRERGADVVEAAFVLPIILSLLLGLVVFARGWNTYQTMTRAAREGVRQAVTTSCAMCGSTYHSNTYIKNNFVFPALQAGGVNTSNALLNSTYSAGYTWLDENHQVCGAFINFDYPYAVTIPFVPLNLGRVDLKTFVQMRIENEDGTCPP